MPKDEPELRARSDSEPSLEGEKLSWRPGHIAEKQGGLRVVRWGVVTVHGGVRAAPATELRVES